MRETYVCGGETWATSVTERWCECGGRAQFFQSYVGVTRRAHCACPRSKSLSKVVIGSMGPTYSFLVKALSPQCEL